MRSVETRSPRARSTAGFTLLEMVLALAIFGMITAVVYSAFYFGHRAVNSGERSADDNQRMRIAEELIGRQVRSAVYYFVIHDEDQVPFFLGYSDGMSFVTSAPQSHGGTGLVVATYRLVEGRLVLEERTTFTPGDLYDPPADARVERAVLLEGFSSLRFEYVPHEEDLGTTDKWDARDEDTLPAAVRITIDGLAYFGGQPWVREIPLFTIAYGWGTDDYQDPPDDEEDDDGVDNTDGSTSPTGDDGDDDDGSSPDDDGT